MRFPFDVLCWLIDFMVSFYFINHLFFDWYYYEKFSLAFLGQKKKKKKTKIYSKEMKLFFFGYKLTGHYLRIWFGIDRNGDAEYM